MATERERRTAAGGDGRPRSAWSVSLGRADGTAPTAALGEALDAAPTPLRRSRRTAVAVLDEPGAVAGMLRILDIARAAAQPRPTSEDRR